MSGRTRVSFLVALDLATGETVEQAAQYLETILPPNAIVVIDNPDNFAVTDEDQDDAEALWRVMFPEQQPDYQPPEPEHAAVECVVIPFPKR